MKMLWAGSGTVQGCQPQAAVETKLHGALPAPPHPFLQQPWPTPLSVGGKDRTVRVLPSRAQQLALLPGSPLLAPAAHCPVESWSRSDIQQSHASEGHYVKYNHHSFCHLIQNTVKVAEQIRIKIH